VYRLQALRESMEGLPELKTSPVAVFDDDTTVTLLFDRWVRKGGGGGGDGGGAMGGYLDSL
jgi:hypothetical protein